ncbi:MAG: AAA family ATPase [Sulfitobacter sp.]|nr:AAA family ATPase [Sulfitobacter sp.]
MDVIATNLLPEPLGERYKSAVRMRATRLRRALGPEAFPDASANYQLSLRPDDVDIWRLLELAATSDAIPADGLSELLAGAVCEGLEPTDLLRDLAERVSDARRTVLRRVVTRASGLDRGTLRAARRMLDEDPYDEELVTLVVEAHLQARATSRASTIVSQARQAYFEDLGLDEVGFLDHLAARVEEQRSRVVEPVESARGLPEALSHHLAHRMVGRLGRAEQIIDTASDPGRVALLRGSAGVGKTRLLAEVASGLQDRSREVIYLAGLESARSAYGPFVAAFPTFREAVVVASGEDSDVLTVRAKCWNALWTILDSRDSPRATLVIDDAQWLDSQSALLAEFLIKSIPGSRYSLVLAGRYDRAHEPWVSLQSAAQRVGATEVELEPLNETDLLALIDELQPTSSAHMRRAFAADLVRLSGGLPAIARIVIENADPETLHHQPSTRGPVLDPYLFELSEGASQTGLAGAVLGDAFTIAEVATLTGTDEGTLLEWLDELIGGSLLRETDFPERVAFSHVLVKDAFMSLGLEARRRRLHRTAAETATDPHARARHLDSAVPLVPAEQAVAALIESAMLHHQQGAYREAVEDFRRARQRHGEDLPARTLIVYSSALDRAGLDGHRVRENAFAHFESTGDWPAALDAAMSGLPEAEVSYGDDSRIALLLTIDTGRLERRDRLRHALETSRQLALKGRTDQAVGQLETAEPLISTPAEEVETALVRRLVTITNLSAADRAAALPELSPDIGAYLRCRLLQLKAIDLYSAGEVTESMAAHIEFSGLADELQDPLRRWHARAFDAMVAATEGRLTDSARLADEATLLGHRYGIRESAAAWATQMFTLSWTRGAAGELHDLMDHLPPEVASAPLAAAGRLVSQYEHRGIADMWDEFGADVESVARLALRENSMIGQGILVLLAPIIGDNRNRCADLAADVSEALAMHRGAWLILGAGVANFGPFSLSLGHLSSGEARDAFFREAVEQADGLGLLTWRIASRLQIAATGHTGEWLTDAGAIAAGSEFEQAVAEFSGSTGRG